MNKRLLRWITIIIPVGFLVAVLAFLDMLFVESLSFLELLAALILVSVGGTLFSNWIFGFIDLREAEIERRANQSEALNTASLALTTELDLGLVLQKVVDLSRELVSSKYGALGVLDTASVEIEQFVTSGIPAENFSMIGGPPHGKGILGIMIEEGRSLKIEDIQSHERATGFPEHHPDMKTLLGVPIKTKGKVIGDLYLAEKIAEPNSDKVIPFTEEDQKILEMFAIQAAIAIENARLYRQVQELAILEERQRFGMDLHDGIIQSIYAVGLMLEDVKRRVKREPGYSQERIETAVLSLNTVISDLRNYILDLRPQHFQGRNVVQGIEELARALRANTFMEVEVNTDGIDPQRLTPEQTVEILHIAQEALSNVQKHAHAADVCISLRFENSHLEMLIEDNGVTIPEDKLDNSTGNGLKNMRERSSLLGGNIHIGPRQGGGTIVELNVPVKEN